MTSIGTGAFYSCSSLTGIAIPDGVTSIGNKAFEGCTNLQKVFNCSSLIFQTGTEGYGYVAYYAKIVYQGGRLFTEDDFQFYTQDGFCYFVNYLGQKAEVILPNNYKGRNYQIGDYAFSNCTNLTNIIIPEGVTSIGSCAFSNCSNLTTITLPEGVTSIGSCAFWDCSSLTTITLPEGVTSIGSCAFWDCSSLTAITLPKSVTRIGNEAFWNCSSLTTITIPEGVTNIEDFTFAYCSSLTTIVLPTSIRSIYYEAFACCPELTDVYCYAEMVPTTTTSVFNCSDIESATLHVPVSAIANYKGTVPWSQFGSIMGIITLSESSITLTEGNNLLLTATVQTDNDFDKLVTWTSSAPSIATIDNTGKVTAIAPGTAIVTAAVTTNDGGGVSASCVVTVVPRSYVITFIIDGEVYSSYTLTRDTPIDNVTEPVREGYTFSGWSKIPETMPAEDITVTGTFTINTYKLTFMIDGEVYHTDSVLYNSIITVPEEPVKEEYTFNGWSELPEKMPAKDITVIGTYTINSYKLTYTVDGKEYYTDSVAYQAILTPIADPIKEGYTFSGWSDMPNVMPSRDVLVIGTFSVNTYKVIFMIDDHVYRIDSIAFGMPITPPELPINSGYTFSGWSEYPATMPAQDLVITGVFWGIGLASIYTDEQGVIYNLNDEGNAYAVANVTNTVFKDLVIPDEINDVPVTSINERAFIGQDKLESIVIPVGVTMVGYRAFYGCSNLLVVEWNTTAPVRSDCFDKIENYGNLIVFVNNPDTEVKYNGNVVIDGVADRIVLESEKSFRNPREFTACHITFMHNFSKKSKIGVSGGWEAMVLPFDVQRVVSESKGELKPFGETECDTSLHYWLGELQADGTFAAAQRIEGNKPFIMLLPNSDEYEDCYNVEGEVSFSAEDVVVHVTTDVEQEKGIGYSLLGSYEGTELGNNIYALNDEEYMEGDGSYMPGGVFVADSRAIRPFEAYIYSASSIRAPYLRIGDCYTGIKDLVGDKIDDVWYTLQGILLSGRPTKPGVYIKKGKKVMFK